MEIQNNINESNSVKTSGNTQELRPHAKPPNL